MPTCRRIGRFAWGLPSSGLADPGSGQSSGHCTLEGTAPRHAMSSAIPETFPPQALSCAARRASSWVGPRPLRHTSPWGNSRQTSHSTSPRCRVAMITPPMKSAMTRRMAMTTEGFMSNAVGGTWRAMGDGRPGRNLQASAAWTGIDPTRGALALAIATQGGILLTYKANPVG